MDIVELVNRAVELASRDEELKEKLKDTAVSIVLLCKDGNGQEQAFTFLVNKGRMEFSQEALENPDFRFEMATQDFTDLMTGEAYGMVLMASGKMKMTKGTWGQISKVATPLSAIPRIAREIASEPAVMEV